jgi:PAS domain S-box-containing protein
VMVSDISDIAAAQEALRTSHSRLESAMEAGNLAWWEMECSTGKVSFSKRKAELLGYPAEQFSHYTDFTSLLHPDDYDHTMQAMQDHLSGVKKNYEADYRIRTISGEYRWFYDTGGVSKYGPDGAPLKVTGLVMDITGRKQADLALNENEVRYRGLINGVPDYILVHRNGKILFVNPAAIKVIGRQEEDLVGSDMMIYIAPESRALVVAMVMKRAAGEVVPPYEIEIITKGGEKRVTEVHGSLITFDGMPASLNVLSDITDRKHAEEMRERLFIDLKQKNAELERFTYTVSHDLKSPLITIKGFLGYLEKDASAGDATRLHDDIARIHTATSKMEEFITALLELSRIGRIVNPPIQVPLALLVQEAVEALHAQIHGRGITLTIPGDLPEIFGDQVRLQQVMTNIIGNAVKFMGDQKEPRIEISTYHQKYEEIICVQDNGIGIAPENLDTIFSVFTRFNPEIPGAGIGLALVKRIIEVHGGQCSVESQGLGKGSRFCFSLPDKPPEEGKSQPSCNSPDDMYAQTQEKKK